MNAPDVICIGSALWDIIGRAHAPAPHGADVPGRVTRRPGGVALNIAMNLRALGLRPTLLTVIGRDRDGEELIAACARMGLCTAHACRSDDMPTDRYVAIEDAGGLVAAIADARALEAAGEDILRPLGDGALGTQARPWAELIALDGNLTAALLARIAVSPLFAAADLRVAPASPGKAARLAPLLAHPRATIYANLAEASILTGSACRDAPAAAAALVACGAARALVTDGARECAEGRRGTDIIVATPPAVAVTRITGAGDSFMAAHVAAEMRGAGRAEALDAALAAAARHVSGDAS